MLYTYIHKRPYDSLKVETVEWCSSNVELYTQSSWSSRSSSQAMKSGSFMASPMTWPLVEHLTALEDL